MQNVCRKEWVMEKIKVCTKCICVIKGIKENVFNDNNNNRKKTAGKFWCCTFTLKECVRK